MKSAKTQSHHPSREPASFARARFFQEESLIWELLVSTIAAFSSTDSYSPVSRETL